MLKILCLNLFFIFYVEAAGAVNFLFNVQVNKDTGNMADDREAAIAVTEEGIIYTAWVSLNPATDVQDILFSRSLDGGVTFEKSVRINDNSTSPYDGYSPDLALDADGNIYAVWFDYRDYGTDNNIDVYLDKSVNQGADWGVDVCVSNDNRGDYPWQFHPRLSVDKNTGNIYVTFSDYNNWFVDGSYGDVCVAASKNGGVSFDFPVRVNDITAGEQLWSSIAVDKSGSVYVVWSDNRNGDKDVYISKSSDEGVSFAANCMVNDVTINDQLEPDICIGSNGEVYVVWRDWRADASPETEPYENNIYFTKSVDGSSNFSSAVRVSDASIGQSADYAIFPRITYDDAGNIYAAWHDSRNSKCNAYSDLSLDGGQNFSTDIQLNDDNEDVTHALPRLASLNNDIYAVWSDGRNLNDNLDIFFVRSAPSGDLNSDDKINSADLGIMMSCWGSISRPAADLNQDGNVDAGDFCELVMRWKE